MRFALVLPLLLAGGCLASATRAMVYSVARFDGKVTEAAYRAEPDRVREAALAQLRAMGYAPSDGAGVIVVKDVRITIDGLDPGTRVHVGIEDALSSKVAERGKDFLDGLARRLGEEREAGRVYRAGAALVWSEVLAELKERGKAPDEMDVDARRLRVGDFRAAVEPRGRGSRVRVAIGAFDRDDLHRRALEFLEAVAVRLGD